MRASRATSPAALITALSAALLIVPRPAWCAPASAPADDNPVRAALESAAADISAGRARQALAALEPAERLEPDNPWLAFYRGLAHLQLGNAYLAMEQFDRGIEALAALGNPEPDLADAMGRYRQVARRQTLTFSYRMGLAYDTNVSYLGSNVALGTGLISGRRDSEVTSRLELAYAPVATEKDSVTVGVRLDHAWYGKIHEFNYQDYGATLRYARRLDDHWEVSLRYDYDLTLLDNQPFLSNHAVTPALDYHWRMAPRPIALDTTSVYYQYNRQHYPVRVDPRFNRDGDVHVLGAQQSFTFQPLPAAARNGELACGYRYESYITEGTEFDQIARHLYLDLNVPVLNPLAPQRYLILPDKELMFRFSFSWELDGYRNVSVLDGSGRQRRDTIRTYGFCLSQKLLQHPRYGDLTLHGLVNLTDADSNIVTRDGGNPFTYNKVVYGAQLEWSW